MDTSLPRGTVLLCKFPYDEAPHEPGPAWHFCLAEDLYEHDGKIYVVVCYGTSATDDALLARHRGAILTVDKAFIKGIDMPKSRGQFIADRVALLPYTNEFVHPTVRGRLDCFRAKGEQETDAQRARLLQQFERIEKILIREAIKCAASLFTKGKVGLPAGKTLR